MDKSDRNQPIKEEGSSGTSLSAHPLTWTQRNLPIIARFEGEPHPLTRALYKLGCPPSTRPQDYGDLLEIYRRALREEDYVAAEKEAWREAVEMIRFGPRRTYYLIAAALMAGVPLLITAFGGSFLSWVGLRKKE